MPDAIRAAITIMEADAKRLIHRNSFNVTAMSFSPRQLAESIRKHKPNFQIEYQVDPLRQSIAESWPDYMDQSCALEEWDWKPEFLLDDMVEDMLKNVCR